jgi:hypothetical protein
MDIPLTERERQFPAASQGCRVCVASWKRRRRHVLRRPDTSQVKFPRSTIVRFMRAVETTKRTGYRQI